MSISRVLWARRSVILTATLSCLAGGVLLIETATPRYESTARVELQFVKPDPVTGQTVSSKGLDAYLNAQFEMIRDFQTGVRVAQQLGWLDSPDLQAIYSALPPQSQDFEHWVSSRVTGGISVRMLDDSNVLEIKYRALTPETAQLVTEAIRSSYIDAVTASRRESAKLNAQKFAAMTETARVKLVALQTAKFAFEKQTGLLMGDRGTDSDSTQLAAMAGSGPPRTLVMNRPAEISTATLQLMQIDSALTQQSQVLGKNNPTLQALERRRNVLAAQVAMEQDAAAARAEAARPAKDYEVQLKALSTKVINQRPEATKLRLMQDEINAQKQKYRYAARRTEELKLLSSANAEGIIAVGPVDLPKKPAFPNKPLILGGVLGLGLVVGLLLASLTEMMSRRVRTVRDLKMIVPGSNDMVIPLYKFPGAARSGRWFGFRKAGRA